MLPIEFVVQKMEEKCLQLPLHYSIARQYVQLSNTQADMFGRKSSTRFCLPDHELLARFSQTLVSSDRTHPSTTTSVVSPPDSDRHSILIEIGFGCSFPARFGKIHGQIHPDFKQSFDVMWCSKVSMVANSDC